MGCLGNWNRNNNMKMRRLLFILTYYLARLGLVVRSKKLIFYESPHNFDQPFEPCTEIKFSILDANQIRASQSFLGWLRREDAISDAKTEGRWMLAAYKGKEMVGNCWLHSGSTDLGIFEINGRVAPDCVYITHVYVHPSARNYGLAKALITNAMKYARSIGYGRCNLCCVPENSAMIRIMCNLGWSYTHRAHYLRLFCFRRYSVAFPEKRKILTAFDTVYASSFIMHGMIIPG